jgi:4'-phosphopantetheinyl transferase
MAGTSNGCNPESTVSIWLSREPELPDWPALTRCLTPVEKARMETLSPARQLEYSHSRWLLRQALGEASGLGADQCHPVEGRPVRSASPGGWALSLSHSHGVSACAISSDASIGVDIEPSVRRSDWQRIVKRWFTDSEQDWLLAIDSVPHFLRVWTLKEAWLKATKRGIAGNLQTLVVDPAGRLVGDDPDIPWAGGTGEVDGITLGVVYQIAAGANAIPVPQVFWVEPPASGKANHTTARTPGQVDWWTTAAIETVGVL